jgi:hypothetical protein
MSMDDCLFGRNFLCNLGAGDDVVGIENAPFSTGDSEFLGNLVINAGSGTDQIRIAGSTAATVVYAYGAVAITQPDTLTVTTNAHHLGHSTFV